jgi:hypothetical protein
LLLEPQHRLRQRIGQLVAAQVIEDANRSDDSRPRALGYHAYNAILRNQFGKPRAAMTLAELEAVIGWLERNRLADYLSLLDHDPRYRFSAARRGHAPPPAAGRTGGPTALPERVR